MKYQPDITRLYTPGEVARLLGVDPRTVTRWARSGKLPCLTTPGGHRRFNADQIDALLRGDRK